MSTFDRDERSVQSSSTGRVTAAGGFRDPGGWSEAGKCLFVALVFQTFTLWYWADWSYVRAHPDSAPYMDHAFLPTALRIQSMLLGTWAVVILLALAARHRGWNAPTLIWVTLALCAFELVYGSYFFGLFTSLFSGLTIIASIAVGLVLFEKKAMLLVLACIAASLLALGIAQQQGRIPYAPLFREAPYQGGELHASWLVNTGGVTALMMVFIGAIIYFVVDGWHKREAALAVARSQLERANGIIRRYIPGQLADRILAGWHPGNARPERRKLTLFFSDIVGFTRAADQLEPEDLADLLNEYLFEMARIAEAFGATINQFVGDGIMAFFGAPEATNDRDHALRCVRMALAMQQRMAELGEKWFAEGIETPFRIRVGINTGVASVGDFGSEGRTTYSAIGNQTNLTARIQAHCEPGKVLISHTTWALVKDEIPCEERGEIEVKGLHYPVRVYEVAAEASPADA